MSFPPPSLRTNTISIGDPLNLYTLYGEDEKLKYRSPSGPTGILLPGVPQGVNYSDYIYWNSIKELWEIGSENVHLGREAGFTGQGFNSVAIGYGAGNKNQGTESITIGGGAGQTNQGNRSIAIGYAAGSIDQEASCIAIGESASTLQQKQDSISIGTYAGYENQGIQSISLGSGAGYQSQGEYGIAIGKGSGYSSQSSNAIAIGNQAGYSLQNTRAIAIGQNAGYTGQGSQSIAIGYNSGYSNQYSSSIALGLFSGYENQNNSSIAIGTNAGRQDQSLNSIAIGSSAGRNYQAGNCIALGYLAGNLYQNTDAIALGQSAGREYQNINTIAIGTQAGRINQGTGSVAIGYQAGFNNQKEYCISIGYNAGFTGGFPNTIILNADQNELNPITSGFFVNPVSNFIGTNNPLYYDTSTKEIYYNTNLFKPFPTGNTLTVDDVYGDDTLGALNPYYNPFKTISAALALASPGQLVFINPGTYNEALTIPNNVSVSGAGTQCVIIQQLDVTANTTLVTVGTNCRFENFTLNLTSSGDYDLTGMLFPSGSSVTTKIRNSVWNITSTASGSPTIIGALSNGTSSTSYTAVNAIQRTSINVTSSSLGTTRGILVSGDNRFSVRDMVVYARGSGSDIVGAETTNASAYLEIKTSTVGGVLYDVNRTSGTMLIGFTDLQNNKANGNSFSTVVESSSTNFGVIGNLSAGTTYYLAPGTVKVNDLSTTTPFTIPFSQACVLISGIITFTGTIPALGSITLHVHKNNSITPDFTISLGPGEKSKVNTINSVDFASTDVYHVELVIVGNPGSGTFNSTLSFY